MRAATATAAVAALIAVCLLAASANAANSWSCYNGVETTSNMSATESYQCYNCSFSSQRQFNINAYGYPTEISINQCVFSSGGLTDALLLEGSMDFSYTNSLTISNSVFSGRLYLGLSSYNGTLTENTFNGDVFVSSVSSNTRFVMRDNEFSYTIFNGALTHTPYLLSLSSTMGVAQLVGNTLGVVSFGSSIYGTIAISGGLVLGWLFHDTNGGTSPMNVNMGEVSLTNITFTNGSGWQGNGVSEFSASRVKVQCSTINGISAVTNASMFGTFGTDCHYCALNSDCALWASAGASPFITPAPQVPTTQQQFPTPAPPTTTQQQQFSTTPAPRDTTPAPYTLLITDLTGDANQTAAPLPTSTQFVDTPKPDTPSPSSQFETPAPVIIGTPKPEGPQPSVDVTPLPTQQQLTPQPNTPLTPAPRTPQPVATPAPPPTPQPTIVVNGTNVTVIVTPTPTTPRPLTPAPATPAPTQRCVASCGSRGQAWYSAATNTCGCWCYWPYGGSTCSSCYDASYIMENGQCVSCVNTTYRQYYAIGGSQFPFRVQEVRPGCLAATSVEIMDTKTWSRRYVAVSNGIANIPVPQCTPNDEQWQTYLYVSLVFGGSMRSIGSIRCVPAYVFDAAADVPADAHIHVQEPRGSMPAVLGFAAGLWLHSAVVNAVTVSLYDGRQVLSFNPKTQTILQFQRAVLDFIGEDATSYYWDWYQNPRTDGCSFFSPANTLRRAADAIPAATKTLLITGDLRFCGNSSALKQAWNAELLEVVQRGANALWIGVDPSPPSGVSGISFNEWDAFKNLYASIAKHFLMNRPLDCTGALGFFPAELPVIQRSLLSFSGVCRIRQCCIGSVCSPFVVNGGRPACYIPPTAAGNHTVSVVTEDGEVKIASRKLAIVDSAYNYYTWRWLDWQFINNAWVVTSRNIVSVYRMNGWFAQGVVNAARCCSLVALTFDFRVSAAIGQQFCFESYSQTTLPCGVTNLLAETPFLLALQCYRPLIENNETTYDSSDVVGSVPGKSAFDPVRDPAENASDVNSGLKRSKSRSTQWKIERYVDKATNNARGHSESRGKALSFVISALKHANLVSTHPPEQRPCNGNKPCYYEWVASPKDAGPHLISAGFTAVPSDWYWSNAKVGDIAVYPAVSYVDANRRTITFDKGHIAIRNAATGELNWVSDFTHTKMVYPGLYEALEAGRTVTTLGEPTLYRLRDDVGEYPMNEEELVPVDGTECIVQDAEVWTNKWCNGYDSTAWNRTEAVATITAHFNCPAFIDPAATLFPAQLWQFWLPGTGIEAYATSCFRMWPTADRQWGLRCCYDASNVYIPEWPSQIEWGAGSWTAQWAQRIAAASELIACARAGGSLTTSCQLYQQCRPAPPSTNNLWGPGSWWTPQRRWGGVFGDPHCESNDGLKFECNYHGEALYTACGDWRVHAVAETPKGNEQATVITRFAVKSGSDTVLGLLKPLTQADIDKATQEGRRAQNFALFLNGKAVDTITGARGTNVVISVTNATVTITDSNENAVSATFLGNMIALSTSPSDACRGKTTGLCGNTDGDATNDLKVRNMNVVVPHTADNRVIYQDFVLSWLVTDPSESLFPANSFLPGNTSFLPIFGNASMTENCPAACKGDVSCCFDASIGGETFVEQFTTAKQEIATMNAVATPFDANWPPAFTSAPSTLGVPSAGHATEQLLATFRATDDSTVTALTCTLCGGAATGVRCDVSGLGTNIATLELRGTQLPEGTFRCEATDALGAKAAAATIVSHSDKPRVISSPAPQPTLPPTPQPVAQRDNVLTSNAEAGVAVPLIAGLVVGGVVAIVVVAVVLKVFVFGAKATAAPAKTASYEGEKGAAAVEEDAPKPGVERHDSVGGWVGGPTQDSASPRRSSVVTGDVNIHEAV